MQRIYVDNNATTPVAPEVFEAMKPYLAGEFGNASSIHWYGQRARAAVEEARESVARLINAQPSEIVFTSGGTESDNAALFGAADTPGRGGAPHVITSAIEHHAVLYSAKALEKRGVRVSFVPADENGVLDLSPIEGSITPETVLVSVMHANNELGTIQPVEEIGRIARRHGVPLHTDAVQAAGKTPVDVKALGASLLSLSAHKIYGPKGVGALYVRKGTPFHPLIFGGHHERDRRGGTENVAGIVGFGKAAELALEHGAEEARQITALRDRLERGLLKSMSGISVNGARALRVPNTSSISFEGVEGEGLVISLDLAGIACSTGAACSSGSVEPSHVLSAIGLSRDKARSTVRFSLGRYNSAEDVDRALDIIPRAVQRLRELSPRNEVAENAVL
ncbi:MAG: cysteine desulfurase family protein [Terriglobia bacterium]